MPSPKKAIESFAIQNGYAKNVSNLLIDNVILPGNEKHIKSFAKGEIDEKDLKERIGFEESSKSVVF